MSDKCAYCENPAEYLCDFVIRRAAYSEKLATAIRDGRELSSEEFTECMCNPDQVIFETCDKPLCEECRVNRGHKFVCGDPDVSGIETTDYCPGHANVPGGYKPRFDPAKTGGRGRVA